MEESKLRSLAKGISWRVIATITTMILVFIFTKSIALSLSVGVFDIIAKLILYYGHERIWLRVPWGKEYSKPATFTHAKKINSQLFLIFKNK